LNKTFSLSLSKSLALDFQNVIALLAIHHIFPRINIAIIMNKININIVGSISAQNLALVSSFTLIFVFISGFFNPKSLSESV